MAEPMGETVCPLAVPGGQDGLDRMTSVQAEVKSWSELIWLLAVPGQGTGEGAFELAQPL